MDSKERLKIVVNHLNKANSFTNEELSFALKYKAKNYVSDIIGGTKPISDFFLERLEKEFKVNPKYIRKGEKPIFIDSNNKINSITKTLKEYPENDTYHMVGEDQEPIANKYKEKYLNALEEIRELQKQLLKKNDHVNEEKSGHLKRAK